MKAHGGPMEASASKSLIRTLRSAAMPAPCRHNSRKTSKFGVLGEASNFSIGRSSPSSLVATQTLLELPFLLDQFGELLQQNEILVQKCNPFTQAVDEGLEFWVFGHNLFHSIWDFWCQGHHGNVFCEFRSSSYAFRRHASPSSFFPRRIKTTALAAHGKQYFSSSFIDSSNTSRLHRSSPLPQK